MASLILYQLEEVYSIQVPDKKNKQLTRVAQSGHLQLSIKLYQLAVILIRLFFVAQKNPSLLLLIVVDTNIMCQWFNFLLGSKQKCPVYGFQQNATAWLLKMTLQLRPLLCFHFALYIYIFKSVCLHIVCIYLVVRFTGLY